MSSPLPAQKTITCKFSASAKEIQQGDSVSISWTSEKTDSIVFLDQQQKLGSSGNLFVKPIKSVSYRFVVYSNKNKARKSISITVKLPIISEFDVPSSISDTSTGTVSWKTENAEKVNLSLINENLPVQGSIQLKIDSTVMLRLTATNKFGFSISEEKKIPIFYEEQLFYPDNIEYGATASVRWEYKNSKEVYFNDSKEPNKTKDSVVVAPKNTSSYHIMAIRNNGDTLKREITIVVKKPVIHKFSVTKEIHLGEDATLIWETENAATVNIIGYKDNPPASGNVKFKPLKTTKYTLEIKSPLLSDTLSHSVTVLPVLRIQERYDLVKKISCLDSLKKKTKLFFYIFNTDMSNYPKEVKLFVRAVDTLGNYVSKLAPPYGTKKTAEKYFRSLVEYTAIKK